MSFPKAEASVLEHTQRKCEAVGMGHYVAAKTSLFAGLDLDDFKIIRSVISIADIALHDGVKAVHDLRANQGPWMTAICMAGIHLFNKTSQGAGDGQAVRCRELISAVKKLHMNADAVQMAEICNLAICANAEDYILENARELIGDHRESIVLWLRTKDLGSFPKETTPQSPGAANANFAPVSLGTAITFKIRFSCNSKPAKEDSPGAAGSRTKNSGAPNASVEVQSEQRQNCPAPQDEQKSTKRKRNLDDDQDSDEEKEQRKKGTPQIQHSITDDDAIDSHWQPLTELQEFHSITGITRRKDTREYLGTLPSFNVLGSAQKDHKRDNYVFPRPHAPSGQQHINWEPYPGQDVDAAVKGYLDPSKFAFVRRNKDDKSEIQVKMFGKEHMKNFDFNSAKDIKLLNNWRRQFYRRQCGNIQEPRHLWTVLDHDELKVIVQAAADAKEGFDWKKIANELNMKLEGVHQPKGSKLAQSIVKPKKGAPPNKKLQLTKSTVSTRHRVGSSRTAIGCMNQASKFVEIKEILDRANGFEIVASSEDSDYGEASGGGNHGPRDVENDDENYEADDDNKADGAGEGNGGD